MENASKALIMAAGILIGVLILTLAVFLFTDFGATSQGIYSQMEERQLTEYNAQYTVYAGRTDITIYEIISLANLAKENNEKYGDYTNYESEYKVQVKLDTSSNFQDKNENEKQDLIKNKSNVNIDGELITTYKCTRNNLPRKWTSFYSNFPTKLINKM